MTKIFFFFFFYCIKILTSGLCLVHFPRTSSVCFQSFLPLPSNSLKQNLAYVSHIYSMRCTHTFLSLRNWSPGKIRGSNNFSCGSLSEYSLSSLLTHFLDFTDRIQVRNLRIRKMVLSTCFGNINLCLSFRSSL